MSAQRMRVLGQRVLVISFFCTTTEKSCHLLLSIFQKLVDKTSLICLDLAEVHDGGQQATLGGTDHRDAHRSGVELFLRKHGEGTASARGPLKLQG